jgi:hypothetical protein
MARELVALQVAVIVSGHVSAFAAHGKTGRKFFSLGEFLLELAHLGLRAIVPVFGLALYDGANNANRCDTCGRTCRDIAKPFSLLFRSK